MKRLLNYFLALAAIPALFSCEKDVDYSVVTDLSSGGTANCYIVNKEGTYKFNARVRGNEEFNVLTPGIDPTFAELLWESNGTGTINKMNTIISEVWLQDGYVYFKTPNPLKNGNAVIAVTTGAWDYTVLWSWHIWVCEGYSPDATSQTYKGSSVMMDRNLGATSAKAGDVHSLGLLYQWGRKDPFLSGSSIYSNTKPADNSMNNFDPPIADYPSPVSYQYKVEHPMTVVFGASGKDEDMIFLWDDNGKKTINDPCPKGWRVPEGGPDGVWAKAIGKIEWGGSSDAEYWEGEGDWDIVNRGINFGKSYITLGSGNIWYPGAGEISSYNGYLRGVGSIGGCWSRSVNKLNLPYSFNFGNSGFVSPIATVSSDTGMSVRCQKE